MSNITKRAMAQSLKKMLQIKDLDKITITDITNDCGINRQTFYYHFKDIYDLLEWIFANEVVERIEKETTIETWQENFRYVLNYMLKNKKFIIKTYNSLSRKTLLDFLFNQYNTIFIEIVENLSKNYNMIKNGNYTKEINRNNSILDVKDIDIKTELEEDKSFSKKNIHLITKEEEEKLEYGRKVHELFELTDFHNIDNLKDKDKDIITKFLDKVEIGTANTYKEYEFIYEKDNITYHGIIDLILEYDDYIKIIDYKLKNINDDAYIKQLNGYKDYIEKVFGKPTYIYLYSIINNKLEKL